MVFSFKFNGFRSYLTHCLLHSLRCPMLFVNLAYLLPSIGEQNLDSIKEVMTSVRFFNSLAYFCTSFYGPISSISGSISKRPFVIWSYIVRTCTCDCAQNWSAKKQTWGENSEDSIVSRWPNSSTEKTVHVKYWFDVTCNAGKNPGSNLRLRIIGGFIDNGFTTFVRLLIFHSFVVISQRRFGYYGTFLGNTHWVISRLLFAFWGRLKDNPWWAPYSQLYQCLSE